MNKNSNLRLKLFASPHIVWSAIFIVVPLIMVAYYSFTNADGNFSMENIYRLSDYTTTFLRSLWYGIIATIICFILAYPIAFIISQSNFRVQTTMILLAMIPMWMNSTPISKCGWKRWIMIMNPMRTGNGDRKSVV